MQEVILILLLTGGGVDIHTKSILPEDDYVNSGVTVKRAMRECHKIGRIFLKMKTTKRAKLDYKCISSTF